MYPVISGQSAPHTRRRTCTLKVWDAMEERAGNRRGVKALLLFFQATEVGQNEKKRKEKHIFVINKWQKGG